MSDESSKIVGGKVVQISEDLESSVYVNDRDMRVGSYGGVIERLIEIWRCGPKDNLGNSDEDFNYNYIMYMFQYFH